MTETPRQFHFASISNQLIAAMRKGEISEHDAETITLYLSETFRREPVPRTRIWPLAVGAAVCVGAPLAAIFLLDLGGLW